VLDDLNRALYEWLKGHGFGPYKCPTTVDLVE